MPVINHSNRRLHEHTSFRGNCCKKKIAFCGTERCFALPLPSKLGEERGTRFRGNSRISRRKVFSGTGDCRGKKPCGNLCKYREDSEDSFNSLPVVIPCSLFFRLERESGFPPIVLLRFYEWMDVVRKSFFFFFCIFVKIWMNAIKYTNEILRRIVVLWGMKAPFFFF